MLVTVLVAQHRGLTGGVGPLGVTWIIAPHLQMASEDGLEGGRGVAALELAVVPANDFENFRGQVAERKGHDGVSRVYSRGPGHVGKIFFYADGTTDFLLVKQLPGRCLCTHTSPVIIRTKFSIFAGGTDVSLGCIFIFTATS